jgi:hypothetical protein
MEIDHIGHSVLHSPTGQIHLQNILHVPRARKSLVSVNRLVTTMFSLNFIRIIFLSRNSRRREPSSVADVKGGSIL